MTELEYNKFHNQYPDAVILERIETETEDDITVEYAAYSQDAPTIIECAKAPFYYDYTNKRVDGDLFKKIVFDAECLENVVSGLTHNMKRVVFVSCN